LTSLSLHGQQAQSAGGSPYKAVSNFLVPGLSRFFEAADSLIFHLLDQYLPDQVHDDQQMFL
jgi:hypothetical protein